MVARVVSGKSIRGILNYNENKIKNAEAELLLACGFLQDPARLSFRNKLDAFEKLTSQNEKTKTNAFHITLNFSPKDSVDNTMLQSIALDYMNAIGFGDQPFLVYRHYDAAHPHIHIATVNIAEGGERIETHNIGRNQSEKARKEIENWYGLIKAEDQQKEIAYLLKAADLSKVSYGKTETKAAISAIVREVVGSYRFTSLPELNAVLRQFNVYADRGTAGSKMFENGGLVYKVLDENDMPVGVPIKASSIYSSPTLKNLEPRYKANAAERKPYALRIKHLLDKALLQATDFAELQARLKAQGVRILLRENVQGNVYGITFIDNGTRCVFNGSDLGKAYSAKAFMERLEKAGYKNDPGTAIKPMQPDKNREQKIELAEGGRDKMHGQRNTYPAREQPVIEVLWDIALSDKYEEYTPNPFRRKRKNLGLE